VIYIKWDSLARSFDLFSNLWKPDWDRMGSLLKIGWPISITVTFEGMLFNAGVLIAGAVGVIEQAGFQIALNVASAAFMMPYGLSMAGAVRIGLARGAGNNPAERRASTTTILASVLAIGIFALPVALAPDLVRINRRINCRLYRPRNKALAAASADVSTLASVATTQNCCEGSTRLGAPDQSRHANFSFQSCHLAFTL